MSETLANGRYEVVRRLAAGGMGEVLLAEFRGDREISPGLLVVKRILAVAPGHPPAEAQVKMLKEEGRLGLRLVHGNLVETFRIEDMKTDGAADALLVIELLAGRSMAQVLGQAKKRKEAVPVDVALAILRGSCCGLHFAHTLKSSDGAGLGIVHRDVSPANIFVTFDGRVKVIDFGVAKSEDSEIKTATGILKGKLGYMSPEQSLGAEKLTPQADVWSLGVFFWEMLVAERLFSSPNPTATLLQISQKPLQSPRAFRPDVPVAVEAICMRMLERDLSQRFSSCAEVARAIDALPGGGGVPRVNVGAFLAGRFPEEADSGAKEAARCARLHRDAPIPQGLVDGDASGDNDGGDDGAATTVLSAEVRAALMKAALDEDSATVGDNDDDAATIRVGPDVLAMVRQDAGLPPRAAPRMAADDDEDLIATSAVPAGALASVRSSPAAAAARDQLSSPRTGPSARALASAVNAGADTLSPPSATSGDASLTEKHPRASASQTEPSPAAPGPARPPPPPSLPMEPRRPAPPRPMSPPMSPSPSPSPSPRALGIANLDRPRPQASPPSSTPLVSPTLAPVHAPPPEPTSWLAVALSTFGALVLIMGVAFSFAISRPPPRVFVVYGDPAGLDVVVADAAHAPAGAAQRLIDPQHAALLKSGDPQPQQVPPSELQQRLIDSGVWARASLPSTTRTQVAALLPVLIAALGLLALAFSLPAFVRVGGGARVVVRALLMVAVVVGAVVVVERGALSWPGRDAWKPQPRLEWR